MRGGGIAVYLHSNIEDMPSQNIHTLKKNRLHDLSFDLAVHGRLMG